MCVNEWKNQFTCMTHKKRNGGHFTPHALSCAWVIKGQNEVIIYVLCLLCVFEYSSQHCQRARMSSASHSFKQIENIQKKQWQGIGPTHWAFWDRPKLLGWGGGGNRVRDKCSYSLVLRTSIIFYFWCSKPKSSCPKRFAQKLETLKKTGHLLF